MIITTFNIEHHRQAFNKLLDAKDKPKARTLIQKKNNDQQKNKGLIFYNE